jgi:hypothetical protein
MKLPSVASSRAASMTTPSRVVRLALFQPAINVSSVAGGEQIAFAADGADQAIAIVPHQLGAKARNRDVYRAIESLAFITIERGEQFLAADDRPARTASACSSLNSPLVSSTSAPAASRTV